MAMHPPESLKTGDTSNDYCNSQKVSSMDWIKGNFTGKSSWENLWFPVNFPLNQSIDQWSRFTGLKPKYSLIYLLWL